MNFLYVDAWPELAYVQEMFSAWQHIHSQR